MIEEKILELQNEIDILTVIYRDFVTAKIPVVGIRTDFVYKDFCTRHPRVQISRRKFASVLCAEFNLMSVQGHLDGKRGCFYERKSGV